MNDRFRFRIWNEAEKKYLKMPESHCDNVGFFLSCMEYEVLEQCTGLKDKNGRLIYEGDILQDKNGVKAQVVWSGYHACFGCDEGAGEVIEFGEPVGFCISDCIVAGNIHENDF